MLILHLSNSSVLKKVAILCAGRLHQGDNTARGNLVVDLTQLQYEEGQCLTYTTRWITIGDLHIQKDFSAVQYSGSAWNTDRVGLYLFEIV